MLLSFMKIIFAKFPLPQSIEVMLKLMLLYGYFTTSFHFLDISFSTSRSFEMTPQKVFKTFFMIQFS